MKTGIYSYITFSGNCREAMQFYKSCLGGSLRFQTIGDSPKAAGLSQKMKNYILHAVLQKDELLLMGTDLVAENGLVRGNAVSLLLNCRSGKELRNYYSRLSSGGIPLLPPEKNGAGILLANLTDKYGHHWMLHFDGK